MEKIPVSVVVPVKNEEKNLPKCLDLLKEFDEVIVVDSNSTDHTPDIVKEYDRQLVTFTWNGQFPKKRNWTLRNVSLKYDWVLFLDADEFVTDSFKQELAKAIQSTDCVGFWIDFTNEFMGKTMKHGAPMRKLPCFKKDAGEYEFIDEKAWSHLDMEIHEHPVLKGKVGELKNPINHCDFRGLTHYIQKHNEYSSWEAKHFLEKANDHKGELTYQQRIKYKLIDSWLCGPLYFLYCYFWKLGFLEGKEGFMFAGFKMQYFFNVKAKITELRKNASAG